MMPIDVKITDGIVIATCDKNINMNLDLAKKIVAERLRLQDGKSCPVVIHMNGLISNSKSVRTYMAKEGIEGISMGAFIVKKRYQEILINLFLTIDAPDVPTRIFNKEEDAIAWINTLRNN